MFINRQPLKHRRRRWALGMTLVEVMVATGIGTMVMAAVASLTFYTARSFASLSNYVELDQSSRQSLDKMVMKIRQATQVTAYSTNAISFAYGGGTLSYTYSALGRTLSENDNGAVDVLLTECDSLRFDLFQRNPVGGSFDQYPVTTSPTNAKLVQVTWTCSRQILGKTMNTESVQSAKIVIRKQ